jgi:hypothetical protein
MPEEYTTVRVKKTTREVIRQAEEKYEMGPAEALENLLLSIQDNRRQILITIDAARFSELTEMTKLLYNMKLIEFPTMECMTDFAINQVLNGLKKQLQVPTAPSHAMRTS